MKKKCRPKIKISLQTIRDPLECLLEAVAVDRGDMYLGEMIMYTARRRWVSEKWNFEENIFN